MADTPPPPPPGTGGTGQPPPPPPGLPVDPQNQPPSPVGYAPAAPPAKRKNRGCLIALLVLGILAVLGLGAVVVGAVFVGRAVDDATDGEGLPGLFGAECLQFQLSFMTFTMTGMLNAGVDEAQREKMEADLRELEELAPSEIADDLQVVNEAFQESIRVGTGGRGLIGGEESPESNAEAQAVLEQPEVVQAQENINTWVEENCA